MKHKIEELDEAFKSGDFLPAKSFISARYLHIQGA